VINTIISQDMASQIPPKHGSPEKRQRDRNELDAQADTFGLDWRVGDRVMTWLNRHEGKSGELSRLVEDGWSWADIGRAMHLTGIAYRTGQPISAAILRKKASEARAAARAKGFQTPDQARPNPGTILASPVQQEAPPLPFSPEAVSSAEDEGPAFRPATLIGHSGRKPPKALPLVKQAPIPARPPTIDVNAVLARFTGRQ
jgi:hypothetical protein